MKKLKAALIAAVAVLMSIGLIACGGKKDPENPTPDNSLSIRSMDLSNTSFTLTDADKDDAAWEEKVLNNLRVLVIYSDNSRNNLDSSGYTVDKSSVQLGVIGVYSAKVTPTANNAAGFSATIEISVEHNIVNGVCTEDGATLTTETIDADLEYKRFHTGDYVLDTHGSSAIRPFGTVTVEGRAETVQTTTVGRLEKGMTITVKGTARTTYPDYGLEDEHWFFPVIGFADTASGEWEYNGGTGVSVMVRNEGWVLLDGVGTSPRLLAAQAGNGVGGAIAETNYGSHPSDTGTKPNNYQAHGTGEPSLDQWIEWYTYSTGTTSDSNTYLTEQNIELSWTYRNDDIIELTYLNTTVASNPVKLVARTKVPASKNGYYDTILHGEYVTMHFTEISTLQTETLASVQYNGLKSGAKTVYLENEMLDLSSLNVQITTVQNSTPQDDASFDVEAKIGNNWVSLSATPLSADMTEFRVTRTKGVVTKEAEIPANFITIRKNGVNEAYAHTVVIDGVAFANNALLGKLDFSSVAEGDGAYALLTLAGAANTLTDAQKAKLTGVTAQKYVAFRIWARDGANTKFAAGAKPTVKSGAADVAGAYVNVTADYADVVLPVNPTIAETGVVISGLTQDAVDVHLNLSGVECLTVASLVSHDTLYLDRGGDVTVVYDFGAEGYASIKANIDRTMLYANTASIRFNVMNKSEDGTTYTTGETKLDGMDVRVVLDEAAGRITVTYSVPKFNVKAVDKYDFSLYTFANNRYARQAIDTVYYEMQFAGNEVGQAAGSDVYVEAEGTKLYIAIAVRANDVLSANVKRETLNLNINDGTLEGLNFTNLGYRYVKGSFLFYSILPEGAVEAELKTFGTLDNSRDTDYGYVVVLTVDAAKLGAKTAPYYFELNAENGKPEYILQATADNKVVRKTLAESSLGEIELITEANCQEVGYGSYAYSEGGQVVFYAGVTEIGGAHEFVDDVCVHCGAYRVSQALVNTVTLNANEFVELSGTYNGDLHKEIYNGVTIRVTAGDHWYWSRSDAYIAKDDYGSNIDAAEIWHSLDDPEDPTNYALRTPVGKLNGVDGEAITEDSFKEAMQNGAFRYRVSYADGVVTIVHSLYKQGESAAPYFSFTVKISDIQRSSVTIAFGLDAAQVTGNVWYANGKVANDMIEEFPNDAFTLKDVSWTVGAEYEKSTPANGTVAVAGNGVATLLDAAHRTALGADAKYTHYIAFAVKFAYEPVSDVFVRVKANGETLKGSVAEIDGNMLYVIIPTDGTVTDYVLDFASTSGNTEQCDVALELSGVVASSVTTSVSGSANLITGGEVTIVYSGVTVTDNDEIEINGISFKKSELTGNKDYGNGVTVKSVTASGTAFTVVLAVAAPDLTQALTDYRVNLKNANGVIQAQNTVSYLALPAAAVAGDARISETVYAKAAGSKLTLILTMLPEGETTLKLNANVGSAIGAANYALIQPYNLTFNVSADGLVFVGNNVLTANTTEHHSRVGRVYVAMLEIDLAELQIAENTAYAFEVLPAVSEGSTVVYSVPANRSIAAGVSVTLNDSARTSLLTASCTGIGVAAESYNGGAFYYNVNVLPSHSWSAPAANGQQTCSVCGAILKGGFATNETIDAIAKNGNNSIVDEGLSISFVASGASSDWASQAIVTGEGNMIITLPNLDPWNNTVASLAGATAREKELAAKVRSANCFPAADNLKNGHAWDSFLNKEGYVTVTISKTGISYYLNGVLAIEYPAGKVVGQGTVADVAELVLLLAERTGIKVAASGVRANDLLVQRGALTEEQAKARYDLYQAEKDYLYQNVELTHPVYSEQQTASVENPIIVGKPDLTQSYTDNAWITYINKGEVLTFAGTQKTAANATANDSCTGVGLFSGIAVNAYFRADNWVNGGSESGGVHSIPEESWSINKAYTCGGYEEAEGGPWATNLAMFKKGGDLTITVDWSDAKKIVISIQFTETVTEGTARVWTDTFTVTSKLRGGEFAEDIYTVTLGCVNSSASITSFVRTTAE